MSDKIRWQCLRFLAITCIMALIAACGGGGGGGGVAATPTVSGIAAVGAVLSGTVYLKDSSSPPKESSKIINADGSYSFNVSGLTSPFILKAVGTANGNNYTLFTVTNGQGTANVNPLANLVTLQAAGGTDLAALYTSPSKAALESITANMTTALQQVRTMLQPLLQTYDILEVDPITDTFVANQEGLDAMLDDVKIDVSNGTVTVTNSATSGLIYTAPANNMTSGTINSDNIPQVIGGGAGGGGGTTYSTADLNGTWSNHGLYASDLNSIWIYSTASVSNGVWQGSGSVESNGHVGSGEETLTSQLSSGGIITFPGNASMHGVLNKSKNIVVSTDTSVGRPGLGVILKKSGTFTTADLAGTWSVHVLQVGDGSETNQWIYGTATISSSGNVVTTSVNSTGEESTGSTTFLVASDGTITSTSNTAVHGMISSDKKIAVITYSNVDGTGLPKIMILVKAGATYSQADLTGNWVMHALMAEDGGNRWAYGNTTFDSSGNMSYSDIITSDGTPIPPTDTGRAQVASNGIVTYAGISDVHGVLTADKNMLVVVGNNNGGRKRSMLIYMKR